MLQRQIDHVDDYNGLWLNGKMQSYTFKWLYRISLSKTN